jgi:hypothetical protein
MNFTWKNFRRAFFMRSRIEMKITGNQIKKCQILDTKDGPTNIFILYTKKWNLLLNPIE